MNELQLHTTRDISSPSLIHKGSFVCEKSCRWKTRTVLSLSCKIFKSQSWCLAVHAQAVETINKTKKKLLKNQDYLWVKWWMLTGPMRRVLGTWQCFISWTRRFHVGIDLVRVQWATYLRLVYFSKGIIIHNRKQANFSNKGLGPCTLTQCRDIHKEKERRCNHFRLSARVEGMGGLILFLL